jgi:hypothetical protein
MAQMFQRFLNEILWGFDFCFATSMTSWCTHAHRRSTSDTFGHSSGNYRPMESCSTLANESFEPQNSHSRIQNLRQGSQPLLDRVPGQQACPPSQTIRKLRTFLGMLKFYR